MEAELTLYMLTSGNDILNDNVTPTSSRGYLKLALPFSIREASECRLTLKVIAAA